MTKLESLQRECDELDLIIEELEEELGGELSADDNDLEYDVDVDIEDELNSHIRELVSTIECYKDELQLLKDKIGVIRGKGVDNG
jgi:prefoldin subunit 5